MTNWYVKELSELTKVSVQTLHHYDRIGLLNPSMRMSNGYRVYSERDLLKLQQIIALKFFGFELSKIKVLLSDELDTIEHLQAQSSLLDKQVKNLAAASRALANVLEDVKGSKDLDWKKIIELIEVYNMSTELRYSYAAEVFTPEELKDYAKLEADLETNRAHEREEFHHNWKSLVEEIKANMDKGPDSPVAFRLAGRVSRLVNSLYGRENMHLKHAKWHKGFMQGKFHENEGLTPELVEWIDQAISIHYKKRMQAIMDNEKFTSSKELRAEFDDVLEEMFGASDELRNDFFKCLLDHDEVSDKVKNWLKKEYM